MKKGFAYLLVILSTLILLIVLSNFTGSIRTLPQGDTATLVGYWIGRLLVLAGSICAVLLSIFWVRKLRKVSR
jgi:hypothetical protein